MLYAALVLVCSIPVYYLAISMLWQYELNEHNIILTPEAGREDQLLIVGAVTLLTVLFFMLLLGGLVLLNRSMSGRLWKPFYHTLDRIRDFSLEKQDTIVFEETDIEEFAELNQRLDKLIAGNIAIYNQQKAFADNASHELQTPLAIIQSKLDLLLQSAPLTNEQYTIIGDVNKALARVSRINKNLLLLAKIENSQFMEKESIDISALLENILLQLATIAGSKQITITPVLQPGIEVTGNPVLIEILLNNLIINAIRYSAGDSEVSVQLSVHQLIISNPGSEPLQQEQLFKRFSTSSSQQPGTGLGLALVKEICYRYNWQVSYAFENRQHIFSLAF